MSSERLGKYELLAHLASGGMANVWLARVSGLGGFERHCVVKTLHVEHLEDEGYVGMFLDEAKVVAALHHQHIAQVFEVGCADDGRYYLAMEYVHGETVRALLDTAHEKGVKIPLDAAFTITIAAATGLHYAHERRGADGRSLGIVHRDVSPSNVIASYDGAIKLIDFGIAKASMRSTQTRTGFIKGKAGYMAPEQARGYKIDRRSDVFALGVLLYELTTQTRAFGDDNQFETVRRTVHGEVARPSKVCPGYPLALEDVVMTALETDPDDRFQDADELRRALEGIAIHLGLALGPSSVTKVLASVFGARPEPWLTRSAPPPIPTREPVPVRSSGFARGSGHHDSIDQSPIVEIIESDDMSTRKFERDTVDLSAAAMTLPMRPAKIPVEEAVPDNAQTRPRPTTTMPRGEVHATRTSPKTSHRHRTAMIGACAFACALGAGIVVMTFSNRDAPADPEPPATHASAARTAPSATPTQPSGARTAVSAARTSPMAAPPEPPAPPPPPATIQLHVVTDPPGATVVLDGVRLGSAPFTAALPVSGKAAWLKVRMPHHVPVKIQVSLEHDVSWNVRLPVLEPHDTPAIPVDPPEPASDR